MSSGLQVVPPTYCIPISNLSDVMERWRQEGPSTIVQPESNGGSDSDGELLQRYERSSQFGRSNLSLIERNNLEMAAQ
jgi:hypothetical protein